MNHKPNVRYTANGVVTLLHVPDPWKACDLFERQHMKAPSAESLKRYEAAMKKLKGAA